MAVSPTSTSPASVKKRAREWRIFQRAGYMSVDFDQCAGHFVRWTPTGLKREEIAVEKAEPLKLELAAFVECVRSGQTPKIDVRFGKAALEIALAHHGANPRRRNLAINPMPMLLPWPAGEPPPDVLVIAGEPSGDEQAARLIRGLRERRPKLRIAALGGPELKAAGAQLLFDLTAHAVVGLVEVLKNYYSFSNRCLRKLALDRTASTEGGAAGGLSRFQFAAREAVISKWLEQERRRRNRALLYIGPQIWAWKAGRRFEMAKWLDALAVIFPFEVDCYKDTDLPVEFVGHPFCRAGPPPAGGIPDGWAGAPSARQPGGAGFAYIPNNAGGFLPHT